MNPMKPTFMAKAKDIERKWYLVDADGKTLGRLASEVAKVLSGKNKPVWTPHVDTGDYVVVINAEKVVLTGKKFKKKEYFHHTGYLGGAKFASAEQWMNKYPERVIQHAIRGMLPKNKLGEDMYRKLHVYKTAEHPHAAQKPETLELSLFESRHSQQHV